MVFYIFFFSVDDFKWNKSKRGLLVFSLCIFFSIYIVCILIFKPTMALDHTRTLLEHSHQHFRWLFIADEVLNDIKRHDFYSAGKMRGIQRRKGKRDRLVKGLLFTIRIHKIG